MWQKHEYYGTDGFPEWIHDANVEGGCVSPGGASNMLGISRQAVIDAVNRGDLEAWVHFKNKGGRAGYFAISVRSILAYDPQGKPGRPKKNG